MDLTKYVAYLGLLVNMKTEKVTLDTLVTVIWSQYKYYFGLMCKDGSDIDGFDKVTLT